MIKRIMNLFCRHKNSEVVCWHWSHGYNGNDIRFIEIELKCKDCGKYFFRYIKDWNKCEQFIEEIRIKSGLIHVNQFWTHKLKQLFHWQNLKK